VALRLLSQCERVPLPDTSCEEGDFNVKMIQDRVVGDIVGGSAKALMLPSTMGWNVRNVEEVLDRDSDSLRVFAAEDMMAC